MPSGTTPRVWLTEKRLQAHGLILALALWSIYAWNITAPGLRDRGGNLKGTDFLHLYTLGSVALEHRGADLYNMNAQAALAAQRVPAAAGISYIPLYPPQASIFFATWARLPYARALVCWLAFSSLLYGLCIYGVWRTCSALYRKPLAVFLLALAFPAFFHLILWGQASALALTCFTLAYLALRSEHEVLAGLALGSLMFKPQLGAAAAVVFLAERRWKLITAAAFAAALQLFAAWMYYGSGPLRDWARTLLNVFDSLPVLEPKLYQTHSLRSFWALLIPSPHISLAFYMLTTGLALIFAVAIWRNRLPLPVRYSTLLLATVLVSPHLIVYDLVILAPAFLLLSDWLCAQPPVAFTTAMAAVLYLAYLSPLLGPLSRTTHLQISVVMIAALVYMIWQARPSDIQSKSSGN